MNVGGFPDDATTRRIHASVLAQLRRRRVSPDEARDLASEVMLAFGRFRGDAKPETFAFAVMKCRLRDHRRRHLRRPTVPLDDAGELADPNGMPEFADVLTLARAELGAVGEPYRDVVRLSLEGLHPREIAVVLEISPNTARSRLGRGLAQLAARLRWLA